MIALCRRHHDFADRGGYSKEELRNLKCSPHSVEDVKAVFPWAKKNFLVRFGGLYAGSSSVVLDLEGRPVITLTKSGDGLLLLSFSLRSSNGELVAEMSGNCFQCTPSGIADLKTSTGADLIEIRRQDDEVGLRLRFRRLSLARLQDMLEEDRAAADEKATEILDEATKRLPPAMREEFRKALEGKPSATWPPDLPEHLRRAWLSDDVVADTVIEWSTCNCADDEGEVPVLDFERLVLHGTSREVRIHKGLFGGDWQYNALFGNAAGSIKL